jgi:hypothetical protein
VKYVKIVWGSLSILAGGHRAFQVVVQPETISADSYRFLAFGGAMLMVHIGIEFLESAYKKRGVGE